MVLESRALRALAPEPTTPPFGEFAQVFLTLWLVARPAGFEPATFGSGGLQSFVEVVAIHQLPAVPTRSTHADRGTIFGN